MPLAAALTLFSAPKPVILHFITFDFNPEKVENCLNVSARKIIDFLFSKKNVAPLV